MREQLGYLIASLNKQLEDELQERLRPAGVPLEQLRVLEALQAEGGRSMGELAARALVEPTTLTNIVDRMVSDGLVYRAPDPNDRRRVLIVMAPAGRALFRRLDRITASQEQRLSRQIAPERLDDLRAALRGLMQE
jgi:DNA-binding MarR family transcriptional regulator